MNGNDLCEVPDSKEIEEYSRGGLNVVGHLVDVRDRFEVEDLNENDKDQLKRETRTLERSEARAASG